MARSTRHSPYVSRTCAGYKYSEKQDKRFANRKLRVKVRSEVCKLLSYCEYDGVNIHPIIRDVSNAYTFLKDGKQYIPLDKTDMEEYLYRKKLLGK